MHVRGCLAFSHAHSLSCCLFLSSCPAQQLHCPFALNHTFASPIEHRRKAKAIEFMVVDALLEADQALRLTDRIRDPALFATLDDQILEASWLQLHWCACARACRGARMRVLASTRLVKPAWST